MSAFTCRTAIEILARERQGDELLILNVGSISKEVVTIDHKETNLYTVAVGYVSAVALGVALALPHVKVICVEGDGSLTMGLEKLCTIANQAPSNLGLLIFDNGTYASAGGFHTATAGKCDLEMVAKGAGIENSVTARTADEFRTALREGLDGKKLFTIVAKIQGKGAEQPSLAPASGEDQLLPPMPFTQTENTYRFIRALVDRGLVQTWHEVYPHASGI
jgi:thiamine pyrophosphate-dependent acetolactate synthase large subunit-like protein